VPPKLAQDIADAAFVNQRAALHDRFPLSCDDAGLVGKGDLGIRDDGGREECMGMPTLAAGHPADTEGTGKTALPDRAVIVTVDCEACTVPAARTGQLMKLEGMDDIIIKILRYGVA